MRPKNKSYAPAMPILSGALAAFFLYLDLRARTPAQGAFKFWLGALIFSSVGAGLCSALHKFAVRGIARSHLPEAVKRAFPRWDEMSFLVFLLWGLGGIGLNLCGGVIALTLVAFVGIKVTGIFSSIPASDRERVLRSGETLSALFFLSGFAAILYQVSWERTLFAAFGVDTGSVTLVVSAFMLGLGLGSIVGGIYSRAFPSRSALAFLFCELGTAAFGLISLPLMQTAGTRLPGLPLLGTSLCLFGLLMIPTLLMGATLPLLIAYLDRERVGLRLSVGLLYTMNTLGAAVASFLSVHLVFRWGGITAATLIAVICNLVVGGLTYRFAVRASRGRAGEVRQRLAA